MRLNNYKFKKKEDKLVFKALMRCMKEDRKLHCFRPSLNKSSSPTKCGFEEIVRMCYVSRENHRGENFQTNIFYWPEDCGGLLRSNVTKFIYIAIIINSLDSKIKELGTRFHELYDIICKSPKTPFCLFYGEIAAYNQCIVNAFMKCGDNEEMAKTKVDTMELLARASEMDLPF